MYVSEWIRKILEVNETGAPSDVTNGSSIPPASKDYYYVGMKWMIKKYCFNMSSEKACIQVILKPHMYEDIPLKFRLFRTGTDSDSRIKHLGKKELYKGYGARKYKKKYQKDAKNFKNRNAFDQFYKHLSKRKKKLLHSSSNTKNVNSIYNFTELSSFGSLGKPFANHVTNNPKSSQASETSKAEETVEKRTSSFRESFEHRPTMELSQARIMYEPLEKENGKMDNEDDSTKPKRKEEEENEIKERSKRSAKKKNKKAMKKKNHNRAAHHTTTAEPEAPEEDYDESEEDDDDEKEDGEEEEEDEDEEGEDDDDDDEDEDEEEDEEEEEESDEEDDDEEEEDEEEEAEEEDDDDEEEEEEDDEEEEEEEESSSKDRGGIENYVFFEQANGQGSSADDSSEQDVVDPDFLRPGGQGVVDPDFLGPGRQGVVYPDFLGPGGQGVVDPDFLHPGGQGVVDPDFHHPRVHGPGAIPLGRPGVVDPDFHHPSVLHSGAHDQPVLHQPGAYDQNANDTGAKDVETKDIGQQDPGAVPEYTAQDWNRCQLPAPRKTSEVLCKVLPTKMICKLYCIHGHTFPEGITRRTVCELSKGVWSTKFDECLPFVDCTLKLKTAGYLKCTTNTVQTGPRCQVQCQRYAEKPATDKKTYQCDVTGRWNPPLPHCVEREGIDMVQPPPHMFHAAMDYPQ